MLTDMTNIDLNATWALPREMVYTLGFLTDTIKKAFYGVKSNYYTYIINPIAYVSRSWRPRSTVDNRGRVD
jgi:hypothetical protein